MFDDRVFSGNGNANDDRARAGRFSYAYFTFFAVEKHCRTSISES